MTSKEIKKLITSAKNVAIFGHQNPDLDCFGALFGAKFLCEKLGAKATIFSNPPKNSFLLNIFDKKEIESVFSSENFDLVMILDCNIFSRLEEKYREEVAKKDNILSEKEACRFKINGEKVDKSGKELLDFLTRLAKTTDDIEEVISEGNRQIVRYKNGSVYEEETF